MMQQVHTSDTRRHWPESTTHTTGNDYLKMSNNTSRAVMLAKGTNHPIRNPSVCSTQSNQHLTSFRTTAWISLDHSQSQPPIMMESWSSLTCSPKQYQWNPSE